MGFPGSHSHNHFVGVCSDKGTAENDGPLHARKMSCYFFTMLKLDQCLRKSQLAKMCLYNCPLAGGATLRRPETRSLQEFSDELGKDMIVATR